jgi:hypothetical protein
VGGGDGHGVGVGLADSASGLDVGLAALARAIPPNTSPAMTATATIAHIQRRLRSNRLIACSFLYLYFLPFEILIMLLHS